jgi:hypothetical protein
MAYPNVTPQKVHERIHYFKENHRRECRKEPEIILMHPDGFDFFERRCLEYVNMVGYDRKNPKFQNIKIVRSYDVDINSIEIF